MQVNVTSDGGIFITPSSVTVGNGDTVRWRLNFNAPGHMDQSHTRFLKWGHIRERYPAANNPLGLVQEISRHDWIASTGSTVTVGGALNWPAGVNSYQYTFRYEKFTPGGAIALQSAVTTATLTRTQNAGGPSVIVGGANPAPVVKQDRHGQFWTTALIPFPPPLVTAAEKTIDLDALRSDALFTPAQGWTFRAGASIAGDFHITRYSAFESRHSFTNQEVAEDCNTRANSDVDNCFTVHWVSRDPAAANRICTGCNWSAPTSRLIAAERSGFALRSITRPGASTDHRKTGRMSAPLSLSTTRAR